MPEGPVLRLPRSISFASSFAPSRLRGSPPTGCDEQRLRSPAEIRADVLAPPLASADIGYNRRLMKSPFPGMDPYLESRWSDVHTALCTGIRTALQPRLPRGLRARAQQDVLLETTDDEGQR